MNTTLVMIWLLVAITFLLVDVFTSAFLFVWFGLGALVALIFAILGIPLEAQIVIFLVASLISISFGYPWARKKFKINERKSKTREEELIGLAYKADEDIIDSANIKLDGVLWRAVNNGDMIKKGEMYKIVDFKGNKVIIEKIGGNL